MTKFNPSIYRHRDKYIDYKAISSDYNLDFELDNDVVEDFWAYARERMNIFYQKDSNQPLPWTQDDVLARYKFCNVYRELDKQSIYIHTKLLYLRDDFESRLLNLMIFRFIAKIETSELLWIYDHKIDYRIQMDKISWPKFGDAYLFPPQIPQKLGYKDRVDFIFSYLPTIAKPLSQIISNFQNINVVEWINIINKYIWVNLRFHFTEILIDVAYQYPDLIDLNWLFHIWPWSLPTMKMMNSKIDPQLVCLKLLQIQPSDFPYLQIDGKYMPITAEWIEWLGCEFRKYTNLSAWNGKRRIYNKWLDFLK